MTATNLPPYAARRVAYDRRYKVGLIGFALVLPTIYTALWAIVGRPWAQVLAPVLVVALITCRIYAVSTHRAPRSSPSSR